MRSICLDRILVTGASGTLGFNLVQRIARSHPDMQVAVTMRASNGQFFDGLANVTQHVLDLTDCEGIEGLVRSIKPEAIVHCAASGVRPSQIGWFEQIHINVTTTMALFRAACTIAGCHFVHVSTGLVYSSQIRACSEHDPIDTLHPYGASKAAADCLLRAGAEKLNTPLTVVRPFSFTGLHDGGDRLFPSLLRAAAEKRPFAMSAGTQIRDFCAVQDVVDGIVLVLKKGASPKHDVFNFGSGVAMPLRELVSSVCSQLQIDIEVQFGAVPFHRYEPLSLLADIRQARSLGWEPRTNLAYAIWELATTQFPTLTLAKPEQYL